jgi:hypothetical protein
MSTQFPGREFGYAACGLILLSVLYVGTYLSAVSQVLDIQTVKYPIIIVTNPAYSIPDTFGPGSVEWFFSPIHEIDRQIRVAVWKKPRPIFPPDVGGE